MANKYIPRLEGYIADVPKLYFQRCDGKKYVFDEMTQASMSINQQPITINAGWSSYPVAYVPGSATLDMQFTSGKFDTELFSMTNTTNFEENERYEVYCAEKLTLKNDRTVTLSHTPVINTKTGLEARNVTVTGVAPADVAVDGTTVTLSYEGAAKDQEVEVVYMYEVTASEAKVDNISAAIGEAFIDYPVYGNGDDCTDAAVIGHVYFKVYRCRVTAQPSIAGSYKSASTYQFTLSAMDAKKTDGTVYTYAYVRTSDNK